VRAFGLGARSFAYFLRGLLETGAKREMWFDRARNFSAYANAALFPVCTTRRDPAA